MICFPTPIHLMTNEASEFHFIARRITQWLLETRPAFLAASTDGQELNAS